MGIHYDNLSLDNIVYVDEDGFKRIEIWRNVPEWEGFYMVSNLGRVKSLSREIKVKFSTRIVKVKILKQYVNIYDYLNISLQNIKYKTIRVHQLVAMAFLNHKPDGFNIVVDHKNGNKKDNRLINLQLITQRENLSKVRLNNKSKYVGVSFFESTKKWIAQIYNGDKNIHLGFFDNEQEASEYYQKALTSIKNGNDIVRNVKIKSSIHKGICFDNTTKKWRVFNKLEGKYKTIGMFKTEREAFKARENYIKNSYYTI